MGNSTFMIYAVFYGTMDNCKLALTLAGMVEGKNVWGGGISMCWAYTETPGWNRAN